MSMSADATELSVEPGGSNVTTITVENSGESDGTAQLSLDGVADGWSGQLADEELTVPAGGSASTDLTLTAPGNRSAGASNLSVTVAGSLQDQSGQFSSSDEVQVAASMPPAPPPPPEESVPWLLVAGSGLGVVGLVAAGSGGYVLHRRERGIEIDGPSDPQAVRPGGEQYVAVQVRNTTERERVAQVDLEGKPEGWGGGFNRDEIELGPEAEERLWLALKPSDDAQEGSHDLLVTAKPVEARYTREEAAVPVEVHGTAHDADNPGRTLVAPIGTPSPDPYEDSQVLDDA